MENDSAQGFTTRWLARCRDDQDSEAWQELANVVWGYVRASRAASGFTQEDLEDAVQFVLLRVTRKLPDFKRERTGSFRAWLRTIVLNVIRTEAARPHRRQQATAVNPELLPSEEDPAERLIKSETAALFEEAKAAVAAQCPGDWRVFESLHRGDGAKRPAADVAQELGMKVSAVWQAAKRVRIRLTEELKRRLGEEE